MADSILAGTEPADSATDEVAYNAGTEEPRDQLNRLSKQMESLLVTMTGDGFDNFAGHSHDIQSSIMWLLYGMAHQIRLVATQIDRGMKVAHG